MQRKQFKFFNNINPKNSISIIISEKYKYKRVIKDTIISKKYGKKVTYII